MSVGVDAALSPAGCNRKIARIFGENAQRPVGADASVRPMGTTVLPQRIVKTDVRRAGRCGHRPLQTWCVFAGVHSFLWVRPAGRTESSAPTARSGMQSKFAAAGGASPSPTLRRNVATAQKQGLFSSSVTFGDSFPSRCESIVELQK